MRKALGGLRSIGRKARAWFRIGQPVPSPEANQAPAPPEKPEGKLTGKAPEGPEEKSPEKPPEKAEETPEGKLPGKAPERPEEKSPEKPSEKAEETPEGKLPGKAPGRPREKPPGKPEGLWKRSWKAFGEGLVYLLPWLLIPLVVGLVVALPQMIEPLFGPSRGAWLISLIRLSQIVLQPALLAGLLAALVGFGMEGWKHQKEEERRQKEHILGEVETVGQLLRERRWKEALHRYEDFRRRRALAWGDREIQDRLRDIWKRGLLTCCGIMPIAWSNAPDPMPFHPAGGKRWKAWKKRSRPCSGLARTWVGRTTTGRRR